MRILIACLAALCLSACATLDGVGARLLSSDVSILETALFIQRARGVEFDLSNFEDRAVVYRAVDSYARFRRGEITEDQFLGELDVLLEVHYDDP